MSHEGFDKLLIADTRRAMAWKAGLERSGIEARRVEARGADAEKAEWQILVRREDSKQARGYVAAVLSGRASLPSGVLLGRAARVAMVGILAIIALLAAWVMLGAMG